MSMAPADAAGRPDHPDARRRSRERRTDLLVAVATAVVALGLLLGLPPLDQADPEGSGTVYPAVGSTAWTVVAAGLVAQAAVLLAARRAPRTTLLVVAAVPVVVAATASSTLFGLTALPIVVAVVLAAVRVPLVRLWPAALGAAALVVAGQAIVMFVAYGVGRASIAQGMSAALGQGLLQAVGAVGLPLLVALVVRSRRDVRRARADEQTALVREQSALLRERDASVDAAVSRERAAMARELHDIAAHHLSGIALMAAAIDRQIDTDPQGAHDGVRQVRAQSTAVLDDLRRLVGLLRDDVAATRSVETVAGIAELVARSGAAVELTTHPRDGVPLGDGIGPLAQLAAYRTVQEALANAAMHAPGAPCTVTIDDRDPDHLRVRVRNAAPSAPRPATGGPEATAGGYGLRGMRERADLVGAGLQVGATDDGGWQVTLTLGREARPADPTSAPADRVDP